MQLDLKKIEVQQKKKKERVKEREGVILKGRKREEKKSFRERN